MDVVNKKITQTLHVKEINESEGAFIAVATAEVVDRDREVVKIDGLDYTTYLKNPIVTWMHDWEQPPIGRVLWIKKVVEEVPKLLVKIQLHRKTELSKTVWELVKDGFIRAVSITFKVLDFEDQNDVRVYTKTELIEVAIVSIPANPQALILDVAKRDVELAQKAFRLLFNTKGAVAPHEVEFLPDDTPWDGAKAREQLRKWASSDGSGDPDKIDWNKYKLGFAWYNEEAKETLGAYKLPHHYIRDGKLVTCWRGVVAAMAALFGARGGVDIPNEDWDATYRHLAKHYRDHGNEPPNPEDAWTPEELKMYFEEQLKGPDNSQKIEQLTSELKNLKNLIVDLLPSLKAVEPSEVQNLGDGSRVNNVQEAKKIRLKISNTKEVQKNG
jgi:HK97 family phage prohead protease